MELRTLTARLLLKYDIAFAPGEDGTRILTETKGKRWRNKHARHVVNTVAEPYLLDHFTLTVGQLDLVFTPATS